LASKTWPSGIKQLCHFSSSKKLFEDKNAKEQAHSNLIYEKINTYNLSVDIELEAKSKELALLNYREKYEI
jgi:UV DNA damage repair endonuclease